MRGSGADPAPAWGPKSKGSDSSSSSNNNNKNNLIIIIITREYYSEQDESGSPIAFVNNTGKSRSTREDLAPLSRANTANPRDPAGMGLRAAPSKEGRGASPE